MNEVLKKIQVNETIQMQIERKEIIEYLDSLYIQKKDLQEKIKKNAIEEDMVCRREDKLQSFITSSFLSKCNRKNRDQYTRELYKKYYDVKTSAIYMEMDYLQSCCLGTFLESIHTELTISQERHQYIVEQKKELLEKIRSIMRKIELGEYKIREIDSLSSIVDNYYLYGEALQKEGTPYTKKKTKQSIKSI